MLGGFDEEVELVASDGESGRVGEEAAVELQQLFAEVRGEAADVHVAARGLRPSA